MLLLPVRTPLLRPGDDFVAILKTIVQFDPKDILILSSKAIATVEAAQINLPDVSPSAEATSLSAKTGRSPHFMEAVLNETKRLHGSVVGTSREAVLTDLHPDGFTKGSLLVPNAGLDESNTPDQSAIGWPHDPVTSVKNLSEAFGIPVIMTDSCCIAGREGVTAFALACCGIDPIRSEIGKSDLFGKKMKVTAEAVADQLAVAANILMGNVAQSTPAVIVKEYAILKSEFCGWVPGIDREQDLFRDLFQTH